MLFFSSKKKEIKCDSLVKIYNIKNCISNIKSHVNVHKYNMIAPVSAKTYLHCTNTEVLN